MWFTERHWAIIMLYEYCIQMGHGLYWKIWWWIIIKMWIFFWRFEMKLCPYLTMRWVAMVTKSQRVVVLKERRGDFRIHGKFSGNYTRHRLIIHCFIPVFSLSTFDFTALCCYRLQIKLTPPVTHSYYLLQSFFHPADLLSACKKKKNEKRKMW